MDSRSSPSAPPLLPKADRPPVADTHFSEEAARSTYEGAPLRDHCDRCQSPLEFPPHLAGKHISCPVCGNELVLIRPPTFGVFVTGISIAILLAPLLLFAYLLLAALVVATAWRNALLRGEIRSLNAKNIRQRLPLLWRLVTKPILSGNADTPFSKSPTTTDQTKRMGFNNKHLKLLRQTALAALVVLLIGYEVYFSAPLMYRLIRESAEAKDPVSQFTIAQTLFPNAERAEDEAKAEKLYRLAADQGLAEAQNNLGFMLCLGRGVPKDRDEAIKWFRKAASQGLPEAQNNLGFLYLMGSRNWRDWRDLPADFKLEPASTDRENQLRQLALEWLTKAADQGLPHAQYHISEMLSGHLYDEMIRPIEVVNLVRKAADQGYPPAQSLMSSWCSDSGKRASGVDKSEDGERFWLRKLAQRGDPYFSYEMGATYNFKRTTKADVEGSVWFVLAANLGSLQAQKELVSKYIDGVGVAKDNAEAYKWFLLAQKGADKYDSIKDVTSKIEDANISPAQRKDGEKRFRDFKTTETPFLIWQKRVGSVDSELFETLTLCTVIRSHERTVIQTTEK